MEAEGGARRGWAASSVLGRRATAAAAFGGGTVRAGRHPGAEAGGRVGGGYRVGGGKRSAARLRAAVR
ncbi:hypothetical protein GCM10023224_13630 [Streptomonospora halophila]|uniref:Uncharacterized protein n=1 Tax=Streptomonospora halophila TaxID=427369 RepID=A0ABP9GA79_9ACTN